MFRKIMKKTKPKKSVKKFLISLVLVTMCGGSLPVPVRAAENTASKMQMAKAEGSVTVAHSSGKTVSLMDNMKLYNGYQVDTLEKSYAWIELDGAKLAKLDAVSEAVIRKKGKQLEILLKSGNIFFNVSEPLQDDETLNIRTSTMVTGIRGTSGWLEVVDEGNVKISVLEGKVEVNVSNPLTGEVKNDQVNSGETAVCQVPVPSVAGTDNTVGNTGGNSGSNDNNSGGSLGIQRESYKREEIGGFVLQEVFADTKLAEKIVEKGGLDLRDLTKEEVDTRVKADEETAHTKIAEVETAMGGQAANVSTESVWVKAEEQALPEPEAVAAVEEPARNPQTPAAPARQPEPVVEQPVIVPPVVVPPVQEPVKTEQKQEQSAPATSTSTTPSNPPAPETQPKPSSKPYAYNEDEKILTVFGDEGVINGYAVNDWGTGESDPRPWYEDLKKAETIKIAEGVKEVGNYVFYWTNGSETSNIKTIEFPSTIEKIGGFAFANHMKLTTVKIQGHNFNEDNVCVIPNSVVEIGSSAFISTGLIRLKIYPHSGFSIGESAFAGCSIQEVYFDGKMSEWKRAINNITAFPGNVGNVSPKIVCQDDTLNSDGTTVSTNNPNQ